MSPFILALIITVFGLAGWGSYTSNLQKRNCGVIFQALETIHLLDTTVKRDIFFSRFSFLRKIAPSLIDGSQKASYPKWLVIAFNEYKNKYYDRDITEHQKQILTYPEQILTSEFRGQQYVRWFKHFCDTKENEIQALKTESAKQRRRDQALECAKYLLGNLMSKEYYPYHSQITKELMRFDINLNIDYSKRLDIIS